MGYGLRTDGNVRGHQIKSNQIIGLGIAQGQRGGAGATCGGGCGDGLFAERLGVSGTWHLP